jgi:hypothetical protein
LEDLQTRENELLRNMKKMQDESASLLQQQKELSARQSIYNQQQLEFVARKNALAAQQFEYAEKLSEYNAQVKTFNESVEKLEADKLAFKTEKQLHEEQLRDFEERKAEFNEEKETLKREKEELAQDRIAAQERAINDASGLQARISELQERERALLQRENTINEQLREFNARAYNQVPYGYAQPVQNGYAQPMQSGYTQPIQQMQSQPIPTPVNDYNALYTRAQNDGIRVNVAGTLRGYAQPHPQQQSAPTMMSSTNTTASTMSTPRGLYNVGATLFKTAVILLCIIAFESLVVFFLKDSLGVTALYPVLWFTAGFISFVICTILYAKGYKPNAKRKKNPSYFVTVSILFVIGIILVTMIAVYSKAQVNQASELFSYVIIPVAYLANMPIFAALYFLFSTKSNRK